MRTLRVPALLLALALGHDMAAQETRQVSFVTNTGAAQPGDTTFFTFGSTQIGVGRLASPVEIEGQTVTFEVMVALEYVGGSGPFHGFVSLLWPNGDAVACRYDGTVVRDAAGNSRWSTGVHVIDGSGAFVGASGRGTVSGFRDVSLGGSVEYTVDLTIRTAGTTAPAPQPQPRTPNGGVSGTAQGNQGTLAVDVVLSGDPTAQRTRRIGADDSVRYGLFRIEGTGTSNAGPVHVSALGSLDYRDGSGPFWAFQVLDFGGGNVLYCRYRGHTTEFDPTSTRILGRLDVIGGTGTLATARGTGTVEARRGGPVGTTQLTSIRLNVR
ncbi:MAG: hypothetical protein RL148_3130 [Planctomycetota bacterium]